MIELLLVAVVVADVVRHFGWMDGVAAFAFLFLLMPFQPDAQARSIERLARWRP